MSEPISHDNEAFEERMVALTRAFGWHRPGMTPCGQAVPIAEAHALLELNKSPGLTQQKLASALNLRKSTVSRVVANLEGRGWIDRTPNAADGRAVDVWLTPQGAKAAADLAAARRAKMSSVLERIPTKRREVVIRALETLIEAMHESNT